jgi:hypothetical protein
MVAASIPLAMLAILIVLGYIYKWEWVGVGETLRPQPTNQDIRRVKTLWDWMQLLIIPGAIVIGTFALNQTAKRRDEEAQKEQRKLELDIEDQRAKDEALQAFLDHMGNLLLNNGLLDSSGDSNVRVLAWAYTLTVLQRVDPRHKRSILDFLYGARLILNQALVIPLGGDPDFLRGAADLSSAPLIGAHLNGVALRHVNMKGADLRGASLESSSLTKASLEGADLSGADLSKADLNRANLSVACIIGANLERASLQHANLSGVKLQSAEGSTKETADELKAEGFSEDLIERVLSGQTNLRGADLRGAQGLTQDEIK